MVRSYQSPEFADVNEYKRNREVKINPIFSAPPIEFPLIMIEKTFRNRNIINL